MFLLAMDAVGRLKVKVKLGKPVTAQYGKMQVIMTLCQFECDVAEVWAGVLLL